MQRYPQLGGRGRVHPRSTVLPMGARWILKRGGVGYPGAYQEQGRGAQLLARWHDQGKWQEAESPLVPNPPKSLFPKFIHRSQKVRPQWVAGRGPRVGFFNVLENTFDTIHLVEGKVAQESAEALRGIHRDGVETGKPCCGRWASGCKDERCMYLTHVV